MQYHPLQTAGKSARHVTKIGKEVVKHRCVLSITINEQARRSNKDKRPLMAATRQLDKRMTTPDDKSAVKEEYPIDAVGFDDI